MRKLTFILALLLVVAASCTKAEIKPNDAEDNRFEMYTRGSSTEVETPGQSDEDNITDPNNDEDESDESSEGDLEALNSKN